MHLCKPPLKGVVKWKTKTLEIHFYSYLYLLIPDLLRQQHLFWFPTLTIISLFVEAVTSWSVLKKLFYFKQVLVYPKSSLLEVLYPTINFSEVWPRQIFLLIIVFTVPLKKVLNTSQRRLEDVLTRTV